MKQKCPIILAAVLAIAAGRALIAGEFNKVVNIGDPMPSFSNLPTTDGSTLSSRDIKEDALVLVFLANHCPWVKGGDGDLIKLVDRTSNGRVRIVGVSVNHREDDRLPAMKEHAAKTGYNFTYVFDESQDIGRRLGAARTPEFFVFDADRKLVYMGLLHNSPAQMRRNGEVHYTNGEPTEFYVEDAIEAVLKRTTPEITETRAQGCNVEYIK